MGKRWNEIESHFNRNKESFGINVAASVFFLIMSLAFVAGLALLLVGWQWFVGYVASWLVIGCLLYWYIFIKGTADELPPTPITKADLEVHGKQLEEIKRLVEASKIIDGGDTNGNDVLSPDEMLLIETAMQDRDRSICVTVDASDRIRRIDSAGRRICDGSNVDRCIFLQSAIRSLEAKHFLERTRLQDNFFKTYKVTAEGLTNGRLSGEAKELLISARQGQRRMLVQLIHAQEGDVYVCAAPNFIVVHDGLDSTFSANYRRGLDQLINGQYVKRFAADLREMVELEAIIHGTYDRRFGGDQDETWELTDKGIGAADALINAPLSPPKTDVSKITFGRGGGRPDSYPR